MNGDGAHRILYVRFVEARCRTQSWNLKKVYISERNVWFLIGFPTKSLQVHVLTHTCPIYIQSTHHTLSPYLGAKVPSWNKMKEICFWVVLQKPPHILSACFDAIVWSCIGGALYPSAWLITSLINFIHFWETTLDHDFLEPFCCLL
jgi:hypothetical protein